MYYLMSRRSAILCRVTRRAVGMALEPPRTRRRRSLRSSISKLMPPLMIPCSKRGSSIWARNHLQARPPSSANSLPNLPRSGARRFGRRASRGSEADLLWACKNRVSARKKDCSEAVLGVSRSARGARPETSISNHVLRHSCGYKLANDGRDTRSIQHYLGHKSIASTVRYTALALGLRISGEIEKNAPPALCCRSDQI